MPRSQIHGLGSCPRLVVLIPLATLGGCSPDSEATRTVPGDASEAGAPELDAASRLVDAASDVSVPMDARVDAAHMDFRDASRPSTDGGDGGGFAPFAILASRLGSASAGHDIWEWTTRGRRWSLVSGTGGWVSPRYSPDGLTVWGDAPAKGVGAVPRNGGVPRHIGLAGDSLQALSPDGTQAIVSAYGRIGSGGQPAFPWLLWSLDTGNGRAQQRTFAIANGMIATRDDMGGAYLPGGMQILFERRTGNFSTYVVARLDLASGVVAVLATPESGFVYRYPSLDHSSTKLVFLRCAGTGAASNMTSCDVMTSRADGTGIVGCSRRTSSWHWPEFSPDGRHVIVTEGIPSAQARIVAIDVETGSETILSALHAGTPSGNEGLVRLAVRADP